MLLKLNHRLHQTADRLSEVETGIESELRQRLKLTGSPGIVSVNGSDVDNDAAPCSLSINSQDTVAVDVSAGTVVFAIGEYVEVTATDIAGLTIDVSITDGQVLRLEYGEVEDGDPEGNPYYNFAAPPKMRKKTAREMLVVETTAAYSAQAADVKERSVVLGVVRVLDGVLTVDNGRDTYSFSRPWSSPIDVEHRNKVGTGVATDQNTHGLSANDLTFQNFTLWQALVGQPAGVVSRPVSFGRIPGLLCSESIPSGSFATDATGFVTGVAGAFYATLGFWPERLLGCTLSTGGAELPAWFPQGRNIVAIFDPVHFTAAANVDLNYTKVQGGSLPGSLTGLTSFDVGQPTSEELIVAGGVIYEALTETRVTFTDVGLIPMKFDVLVDSTGRAYKNPDVIYCNTLLNTLGSVAQPFSLQPRVPTRLRVGISNYNAGYTEVRLLISGTAENGTSISEVVTFTGPGPTPQTSFIEITAQRLFTSNIFASTNQIQVQVRNGDGANTTVTVFAEQSPERPGAQDDLLLATVHWTGSEVNALYSNDADVAIDRRLVTTGGGSRGMPPLSSSLDNPMLVDTVLGYLPSSTKWVTLVEDFANPEYMSYPNAFLGVQTGQAPVELPGNSLGSRKGYISRVIPFGDTLVGANLDALWMRCLPKSMRGFPSRNAQWRVTARVFNTAGSWVDLTGALGTNPYPPYQVQLTESFGTLAAGTFYAVQFNIFDSSGVVPDPSEVFQGFTFHVRQ